MKVAEGTVLYTTGDLPCTGVGIKWSSEELNSALKGRIATVFFDDEGSTIVDEIMSDISETQFEFHQLRRHLTDSERIENWRVGEVIADVWLTDHRHCYFPWPAQRDIRKSGSSLPGADLVGLHTDRQGDQLVFGEVKTSSSAKYPPTVMDGHTGLRKQIVDLRDNDLKRDQLLVYLSHRANGSNWIKRFQRAATRYLSNKSDVQLFAFLVRDVSPNQSDATMFVNRLGQDCPESMKIELVVLYLPAGRVNEIGKAMLKLITGSP